MVGREYEAGGIAKDGAKLVTAVACANVPKFTVIFGGLVRRGELRDVRASLRAAAALDVAERPHLRDGRRAGREGAHDGGRRCRPTSRATIARYEDEGSPYHSTARLWDDGVIDPLDTRKVLALGLDAASRAPIEPTRFRGLPDVSERRVVTRDGPVATLTLDRPDRRNALDPELIVAAHRRRRRRRPRRRRAGRGAAPARAPRSRAGADLEWMRGEPRPARRGAEPRGRGGASRTRSRPSTRARRPWSPACTARRSAGGAGLVACADVAVAERRDTRSRSPRCGSACSRRRSRPYVFRAIGPGATRALFTTGRRVRRRTRRCASVSCTEVVPADGLDDAVARGRRRVPGAVARRPSPRASGWCATPPPALHAARPARADRRAPAWATKGREGVDGLPREADPVVVPSTTPDREPRRDRRADRARVPRSWVSSVVACSDAGDEDALARRARGRRRAGALVPGCGRDRRGGGRRRRRRGPPRLRVPVRGPRSPRRPWRQGSGGSGRRRRRCAPRRQGSARVALAEAGGRAGRPGVASRRPRRRLARAAAASSARRCS